MTVASSTNRASFAGNGVTTVFAFNFPYRASSDLVVISRVTSTGIETLKTEGADYTVSGVANAGTGGFDSANITMGVAPATGTTLVINRVVPLTTALDPTAGAALGADNVEGAIDRAMLAMQGLREMIGRALLLPKSSPLADLALPEPSSLTAGQVLGINAGGTAFEAKLIAALGAVTVAGRETIWIPAPAMVSRTTNGPAVGTAETATNKVMIKTLDFDAATQEHAQFQLQMPKSWNEGTVTAIFVWSHAAAATFAVVWGIQGLATSDDDALDAAFGTGIEVTDTGGTTNDLYRSPETAAVTIGGTPAENDVVTFQVYRNAAAGADTLSVDARLHGVALFLTTTAATDD